MYVQVGSARAVISSSYVGVCLGAQSFLNTFKTFHRTYSWVGVGGRLCVELPVVLYHLNSHLEIDEAPYMSCEFVLDEPLKHPVKLYCIRSIK